MTFPRFAFRRLASAALLLAPAGAYAELKWDHHESTIEVKSWMPAANVKFGFTNTGTTPVRILEVAPSCGCTVAQLSRSEVAPGERGEISAEFHPAGKIGTVRIPIRVSTDSEPAQTTLHLVATISEPLQLAARFVYWKSGDARSARAVRLTVADRGQVELDGVESSNPAFAVQLTPVESGEAGRDFELRITPPADGVGYGVIMLRTKEGPAHAERLHSIVVRTF